MPGWRRLRGYAGPTTQMNTLVSVHSWPRRRWGWTLAKVLAVYERLVLHLALEWIATREW